MEKLLAIVEVDEDLKVYCQAEGCTATVYKRIHVVQTKEKNALANQNETPNCT